MLSEVRVWHFICLKRVDVAQSCFTIPSEMMSIDISVLGAVCYDVSGINALARFQQLLILAQNKMDVIGE